MTTVVVAWGTYYASRLKKDIQPALLDCQKGDAISKFAGKVLLSFSFFHPNGDETCLPLNGPLSLPLRPLLPLPPPGPSHSGRQNPVLQQDLVVDLPTEDIFASLDVESPAAISFRLRVHRTNPD